MMAMSWLVYRLTNSAFILGVIGFTSQIPAFFLTPFAGVLADRWNRKRILVITQTLAMIQAFILAVLAFKGIIAVWHIIILSIFVGLVMAVDAPVRQTFVVDMVERREHLGNAIALNSLIFNSARLIGPMLAGIIIAAAGEGVCFLLNGISFLAVIVALLVMKTNQVRPLEKPKHVLHELRDGFRYAYGHLSIRYILLLTALISILGMSYTVVMPIMAKEILGGGARTLGFLMGAAGLGALGGGIYLASRETAQGLEKIISKATIIFGLGLIAFSFSRLLWLSLLLMLCVGFGMIIQMVSSNTLLQHLTADNKRGRVMSFFTIAGMGMMPLGSLLAGSLASKIGSPHTLLITGFFCLLGSFFFASKILVEKA